MRRERSATATSNTSRPKLLDRATLAHVTGGHGSLNHRAFLFAVVDEADTNRPGNHPSAQ